MRQFYLRFYLLSLGLLVFLLFSTPASATHIRTAEITAKRIDTQSYTYEITLTGYADRDSQVLFGSNGTLDFGDGTFLQFDNDGDDIPRTAISNDTWKYELKARHTFPSARSYVISFREFYRNENILNMDNSVNMPFYIESLIKIDPLVGVNSSPVLTRPAIDIAFAGKTFHHQPGAFDADGDSLAFVLLTSRQDQNNYVSNYRQPHQTFPAGDYRNGTSETGRTPAFTINPFSGDIIWDAPGTVGEYNMTFRVQEWRKINGAYQLIGYVERDLQILVENSAREIPKIEHPFASDIIAPAAGEVHEWTITAQAPTAADLVVLEIWGNFLTHTNATVSQQRVEATGEASITIRWSGEEDLGQHYQLITRAYYPNSPYTARSRSTIFYENKDETPPLGVEYPKTSTLMMYPNPLRGTQLTLDLAEAVGKEVQLQLYNTKGQVVQQESIRVNMPQNLLEINSLKPGIYLLHLHYNGRLYRNKLVIQ